MTKITKQSGAIIRGLICILICMMGLSISSKINMNTTFNFHKFPVNVSFTPHAPIVITSDAEFEVFPGSGSFEDPFIIENYIVTSPDSFGIHISGTTKFFIIQDCYIDSYSSAVYITDVASGTASIKNTQCIKTGNGISILIFINY